MNMCRKKEGKRLYTCAVRPAAIYGPGEERHFPRIINLAKLGLLPFKTGTASVKTDWVYVDNLVLALLLASMGLLDDIPGRKGRPIAAGQPKMSISVSHALLLGNLFWTFYTALYPWLSKRWIPQPLILPAEVYKVGVTHYFSFLKAKEELGYTPMVSPQEGMVATISYWQERKRRTLDGPTIYAWLFAVIGMVSLFSAAFLPEFGPVPFIRAIGLFFLRSMWALKVVFVLAVAAHIGEAIYAWKLAKQVDPVNARGWFWQTFALGFFSLRFLLKRAKM